MERDTVNKSLRQAGLDEVSEEDYQQTRQQVDKWNNTDVEKRNISIVNRQNKDLQINTSYRLGKKKENS